MTTTQSPSVTALAVALAKAQAAIAPAVKDKTNPAFRSKYADLAGVWDACRKPLTDHGLSIIQMPVDVEAGRVGLTTILLHSSGEYISSTVSAPLTKNDPQGVGSALTYLRRYALSAMVGVVADEDDDGNAASRQPQQFAQQQPQRQAEYQQPAANGSSARPGAASDKQIGLIKGMTRRWGWSDENTLEAASEHGINVRSLAELTSRQASDFITVLKDLEAAASAPAE